VDVNEIRSRYWRLYNRIEEPNSWTIDRQIAMAQLEMQVEMVVQLSEMNTVLKRIGVLNIEELALRLEDFFRKTQD
jgi:hypothetical protein